MITKTDPIFVTGGTGFIGSYILRHLVQEGYSNIIALRRKTSRMDLVESVADRINWMEGDINDQVLLENIFPECRAIIHCAAMVSFHKADRDLLYDVNVEGTATLVNAALHSGIKRIVHISSIAALGRNEDRKIIDEDAEWQRSRLNSNYAVSKHLAEMEVWRGISEGLEGIILNPANVMGSGFWNEGTARTFLQIHNGFSFYTAGQTGYVDVRDVARTAVKALQLEKVNQRYVLSEGDYSYHQIFRLIANALNTKAPSVEAKAWMVPFARIGDWIKSKIAGRRPFLSKEIARNSFQKWQYDNQKSIRELGLNYTPIEKTIRETASQFLEASQNGLAPATLPLR